MADTTTKGAAADPVCMATFRDRTGMEEDAVRELVAADRFAAVLDHLDFQCYRAGETVEAELAERAVGYLAAPLALDPARDLSHVTFWVPRPLSALADALPGTYFDRLYEHAPDAEVHRLPPPADEVPADDPAPTVRLVFGRSHGETLEVRTPYHDFRVVVPTVRAYEAASAAMLDGVTGPYEDGS